MPKIGDRKLRYTSLDPEDGPALMHVWTGIQWVKLSSACLCKFVDVGDPLDQSECLIHEGRYACDACGCLDYRPGRSFQPIGTHWPVCVCGHAAQDHN